MKTITILFLAFLGIALCKFKGKPCTALGFDCGAGKICCGDYHCVNDRCQIEKKKSDMKYSKKLGGRCDTFHACGSDLRCESHRCVSKIAQDRLKMVAEFKNKAAESLKNIVS